MAIKDTQLSEYKAEKVALVYCLFGLIWILTSDALVAMLVKDPDLLVSMGTFKGVLFIATTTTLLYLTLKLWQQPSPDAPSSVSQRPLAEGRREIVFVFFGLALLVPLLMAAVAQVYGPMVINEARYDATMLAQSRAEQVDAWLHERESEAIRLHHDQELSQWLDRMPADISEQQVLLHRIEMMHRYAGFDRVLLLNEQFDLIISAGDLPSTLSPELAEFEVREQVRRSDIYEDEGRWFIDWLVPVLTAQGYVRGYVLLSSDLNRHLYPLLSDWAVSRYTAELRLAERVEQGLRLLTPGIEMNEVFHAELEYLQKSGGQLLPDPGQGVFSSEVKDSAEVSMLLAIAPLHEAPWHLLVAIDKRSVIAPVYTLLAWVSMLAFAAVASVGVALGLVWQKSRRLQQLALVQQAAEKDKLLFKFFELPFVGMSITEPGSGRWIRFNEKFQMILGYSAEELSNLSWFDITHPDDLEASHQQFIELVGGKQDSYTIEKRFIRADGTHVPVMLNLRAIREGSGEVLYAIETIQDISDQKRYEAQLMRQRDLYNTLSETNQMIVRCQSTDELLQGVCSIAVEQSGLGFAWFGWVKGGLIRPEIQAVASDMLGNDAEWQLLATLQAGAEPVARVLSHGATVVTEHPFSDASNSSRLQYGHVLKSMACFPVNQRDTLVGVFCVYARENDFFTPDIVGTLNEMADDVGYALGHIEQSQALETAVQVVKASPVMLFRWSLEERWPVIYVSDNITRWGYEPEQFISGGLCYGDLMEPSERVKLFEEGQTLRRSGVDSYTLEYRVRKADGRWIWVEDTSRLLADQQGQLIQVEGVVTEITARKLHQQRLDYIAHHDNLTGLPNRLSMLETIAQRVAHKRESDKLVCMVLDLDRFNDVNDSFGHVVGDELLCKLARRLKEMLQPSDHLCRLSGDEFVILPDLKAYLDKSSVAAFAQKLITSLQVPFSLSGGIEVRIGGSIGISLGEGLELDPEELLRQADTALYYAKESGRNQFRFYKTELTQATRDRLDIETRLREAIELDHLSVYYQPQVDALSGQIVGAEALIRWIDPEQGFIPPGQFIPVAEQSGMISHIGQWVLQQVCQQGVLWLEEGYSPLRLAVNLSAYQIRHTDVVSMVESVLLETGYPATHLELELTESALMSREDEAERVLSKLRELGVSLAIDDFGTGYSSLAYLKRFSLDFLKIDKSFVDDIAEGGGDREIAATIVAISHTLGLRTIAEGVETEEQLAVLRELGCDIYQGYLTSAAVDADSFAESFLQRN